MDFPNPGIDPVSPALQVDSLPTEISGKSLLRQRLIAQDLDIPDHYILQIKFLGVSLHGYPASAFVLLQCAAH